MALCFAVCSHYACHVGNVEDAVGLDYAEHNGVDCGGLDFVEVDGTDFKIFKFIIVVNLYLQDD